MTSTVQPTQEMSKTIEKTHQTIQNKIDIYLRNCATKPVTEPEFTLYYVTTVCDNFVAATGKFKGFEQKVKDIKEQSDYIKAVFDVKIK